MKVRLMIFEISQKLSLPMYLCGVVFNKHKFEFGKNEVEFKLWFMEVIDSIYKYGDYSFKEKNASRME